MDTIPKVIDTVIDLHLLATPASKCVCLSVGRVDETKMRTLRANDYDYAPVLRDGSVLGVIATEDAERLSESGKPISAEDVASVKLPISPTLDMLCGVLAVHGAALIFRQLDGGETEAEWFGLVTVSDLNRHHFRAIIYARLAELETGLAQVLGRSALDFKHLLPALSEDAQARVLGFWELGKLRGVDTGPLSACTLTELLKMAAFDPGILQLFGCRSKKRFNDLVGGILQLRNQVMHPVRPMVLGRPDVSKLKRTIEKLERLIGLVKSAVVKGETLSPRAADVDR